VGRQRTAVNASHGRAHALEPMQCHVHLRKLLDADLRQFDLRGHEMEVLDVLATLGGGAVTPKQLQKVVPLELECVDVVAGLEHSTDGILRRALQRVVAA